MVSASTLLDGPGGWSLSPEGAAVCRDERTAVIADVHLGYEWARGASGDCLPAHSLDETLAKLAGLLARATIERLVVAGDLVESPAPCRRTAEDIARLTRWLADRGVSLVALAGNHDPVGAPGSLLTMEVSGWTIGHGHRPIAAPRTISGHHHPVLRAGRVCAPCFLVGPDRIVLPAFSSNAAGWNILAETLPFKWVGEGPRCIAAADDSLLDFGPRSGLLKRFSFT
jgi:putative SbcD/Mre11-related phosphoesterase